MLSVLVTNIQCVNDGNNNQLLADNHLPESHKNNEIKSEPPDEFTQEQPPKRSNDITSELKDNKRTNEEDGASSDIVTAQSDQEIFFVSILKKIETELKSNSEMDLSGIIFDENDAEEWTNRLINGFEYQLSEEEIVEGKNKLIEVAVNSRMELDALNNFSFGHILKIKNENADKKDITQATELVVEMVNESTNEVRTFKMLFCKFDEENYKLLHINPVK